MSTADRLRSSIAKAYPGPGWICVSPGLHREAITALGVHCLFVQAGFVPKHPQTAKTRSQSVLSRLFAWTADTRDFTPPDDWLAFLPSPEFVFRYNYPGKSRTFVLRCSVKPQTEQMFVHVSEEGNDNIQFVGLLVNYTVPETSAKKLRQSKSWDGVFGDLDLLTFNIETYLMEPLLRKAVSDVTSDEEGLVWSMNDIPWFKYGALFLILSFLATKIVRRHMTKE